MGTHTDASCRRRQDVSVSCYPSLGSIGPIGETISISGTAIYDGSFYMVVEFWMI
jgi:hypothetical protein